MRTYKIVLLVILIAACGLCVWYCYSAFNEQRSPQKGTLVFEEYAEEWRE